ncbi:hypothetical protein RFI_29517, partial [Reticulomyxa filosa]
MYVYMYCGDAFLNEKKNTCLSICLQIDYLTHSGKLMIKSVILFFQELAKSENEQLTEQLNKLKKHWKHPFHPIVDPNIRKPTPQQLQAELKLLTGSKKEDATENETNFKDYYYKQRWPLDEVNTAEDRVKICRDYLTGIQWVLDYYYQGVPSWGWYYPHHYAPLISDMALVGEHFHCQFSLGEPYLPFEQLLAVLPIASSYVLPASFQSLMTHPESLISDMYPVDFTVNMDYATNPWEGVVLLPYIDEQKLKKAVATVDPNLLTDQCETQTNKKEEEKLRNGRGCTYMYRYDPEKAKAKIKTRIKGPRSFGSIIDVVSVSTFVEPPIQVNQGKFLPKPCRGSATPIPGFPQLHILDCTAQLQKIGCQIFGTKSKFETLVLAVENELEKLNDDENHKDLEKKTQNFLTQNETCFVDWPYLREAQVIGAETLRRQFWYDEQKGAIDTKETSSQQYNLFLEEAAQLRQKYLNTYGLDVGAIHVIIHVRPLHALSRPHPRSRTQSKKQPLPFK